MTDTGTAKVGTRTSEKTPIAARAGTCAECGASSGAR